MVSVTFVENSEMFRSASLVRAAVRQKASVSRQCLRNARGFVAGSSKIASVLRFVTKVKGTLTLQSIAHGSVTFLDHNVIPEILSIGVVHCICY